MAVPTNKAELLAAIDKTYKTLSADWLKIPAERAFEATMPGHAADTTMSPADLVAYLIGWNETVLLWLERDDRGQPVDFPATGFKWNELGRLARRFYSDHAALGWEERRARLDQAKAALVDTIASRSDEELYGSAWHGKWTKGRMIQFNTSSPYANAHTRIRAWLKQSTPPL